ncbi:hypothetical protein WOLCODRAFT_140177 [Wolfiporia cocos MD-104 SS10]|uniref:Uncharacterized protein n=1 Tax=Wolfiporia cocos (strain MD-104) TaxID=742152 RepID=A0A2H3JEB0_WOLCO|nr:hypothetical protein WOLCODRAFT_140177 [Wolfiporia cocos MD-104 SS10]
MCTPDSGGVARPRTDHTSLPPELWIEIFRYATYVPRVRGLSPGDPFEPQRPSNYAWGVNTPVSSLATKRSLVLVCRAWRRLATELLYEHVVISSRRRANLLVRTLHESDQRAARGCAPSADGEVPRGHAQWVRHVEIRDCARTSKTVSFWQAVAAILARLPNLHVLSGIWERPLAQNLLDMFSRYLGGSIRRLYWEEGLIPEGGASLLTAAFLPKYQSLRVLDVRKLRLQDPDSFPVGAAAHVALPAVVDLLIPTCPALLRFAAELALPRLRRLVLDAANVARSGDAAVLRGLDALLRAHGPKVATLELLPMTSLSEAPSPISITTFLQPDVCPSLTTLVFDAREKLLSASSPWTTSPPRKGSSPPASSPAPPRTPSPPRARGVSPIPEPPVLSEPHPSLRRVGIRGMGISRLYPNRPTHAQAHLHAFLTHRTLFPALETVRTLGLLVDASTDLLARDIFIWWTEKFEEQGLDLQDGEGVVWLYTDSMDGQEPAAAEEQLVASNHTELVHKSDPRELNAAKT